MPPNSTAPSFPLAREPEPVAGEGDALPLSDDAREALLGRIEDWIEEEERLIAEVERRVAAAVGNIALFPARHRAKDRAEPA